MYPRIGDGTHHKKRHPTPRKGDDTHRKNIIVVDEAGKGLHATYPKRAKGLVKSGRARYVDENTICLTEPPRRHEEEHMENTAANNITIRDIFTQLTEMQKQLVSHEMSMDQLRHSLDSAFAYEMDDPDKITETVDCVCAVFNNRERTLQNLLRLYEQMYADLRRDQQSAE